ncbi:tautomerase family protein [Staphylococcus equorum]|uniref:Tautomerase n=1 Tax=Staphylococcus equorum TaxID=246432 RepID=A0A1E5TR64_9STAP|nr:MULTISPECIES: tautomerase family protein [Staphylococcus]NKR47693.1 tautomerase family protein [Prescottella equi]ALM58322.1 tautomerase [Staphylococcus equorum]ANR69324.1 tautomerase [Staphylococcus equorum]EJX18901.1 4-oxalocrotonate tautomerase [Staphylococcus sp. OJ82]ERH35156.1 tautomerase [Staphylococcus equorum UMC-CNS-924]
MPLIKLDMIKGREKEEIKSILDITYNVMLDAFQAPKGDKYLIVNQHEDYEMEILDTGLGIERTDDVIVFTIVSRPRTKEQKTTFYKNLVNTLHEKVGIRKEDIMISLVENTDENWSFFNGEAQFLTGDL